MNIRMSEGFFQIAPLLVEAVHDVRSVKKSKGGGSAVGQKPKYRYAEYREVLAEALRVLKPRDMAVLQTITTVPVEAGPPVVMVSTMILHKSGEYICGDMAINEMTGGNAGMAPAQAIGSAVTYAKRYSLCAMLSMPTDDDDGAATRPPKEPETTRYPSNREDRFPVKQQQQSRPIENQRDDRPRETARSGPATPPRGFVSPTAQIANREAQQPSARPARQDDGPPLDQLTPPPKRR